MIVPIEKIWLHIENKYKAVNIVSLEARRIKDEQSKGLMDEKLNPVLEAVRKFLGGKIKHTE